MAARQASVSVLDSVSATVGGEHGELPASAAAAAARTREFNHGLHVTRACRLAAQGIRCDTGQHASGYGLGLVLASAHGDQRTLAARHAADVLEGVPPGGKTPVQLFRAISSFPVGRVAKSVADGIGAYGPVATMPNKQEALEVGKTWLAAGRAAQVIVLTSDFDAGEGEVCAHAELWAGDGRERTCPAAAVTATAERPQHAEDTNCARLATEVIERVVSNSFGRTALIVCSMLADEAEALQNKHLQREPGIPLVGALREMAARFGFVETFVFVGMPQGDMNGLALAQDLLNSERADRVIICGVDLVSGVMTQALRLLECEDLPHFSGGAVALSLSRAADARSEYPTVAVSTLLSPKLQFKHPGGFSLVDLPDLRSTGAPKHVALSGLTSTDVRCAEQLAGHVFPGVPVSSRGETRYVGRDVLIRAAMVRRKNASMAVVAFHVLGGCGVCLLT